MSCSSLISHSHILSSPDATVSNVKEHIRTTIAPENDYDTTSKTFKSKFKTSLDTLVTEGHVENPNENISCVKLTQGIKKRIRVGDLQPGQIFKETKRQAAVEASSEVQGYCS